LCVLFHPIEINTIIVQSATTIVHKRGYQQKTAKGGFTLAVHNNWPESNRLREVLQASALPMSYISVLLDESDSNKIHV
jgi:hypothetical protein